VGTGASPITFTSINGMPGGQLLPPCFAASESTKSALAGMQGQRSAVSGSGWVVVGGALAACSKTAAVTPPGGLSR